MAGPGGIFEDSLFDKEVSGKVYNFVVKTFSYLLSNLLLLLLVAGCTAGAQAIKPGVPQEVQLAASDGAHLVAFYYPPLEGTSASPAPGLLLLHEAYQDSQSWVDFAVAAQAQGFGVLLPDRRGSGSSPGEQVFDERQDLDVEAAYTWLASRPEIDPNRLEIGGASLGANLALRAGARHPEVQAVAMLSPGMLLWEIGISEAAQAYGSRPVFLASATDDQYPAQTVENLVKLGPGDYRVEWFPGSEHGTDLLRTQPALPGMLLEWLQQQLP
jgi:dienelactone hydrolase